MWQVLLPLGSWVQLTMDENSTFQAVKERVVAYERLSTTWSKDKVYAELGAVASYSTDTGAAMEINQVSKGKGKGKGSKGKPSQKGKGKDKGKSKDSKGKGKSQHGGKGYATYTSKGGKGQSKNADANRCNYCNGYGHWKKDCRKYQQDKASGVVRQVEGDEATQRVASSPSGSSNAQQSPSATSYRSSGHVNRVAFNDSTVIIEDLTEFSDRADPGSSSVRVVQQIFTEQFEMSCTDSGDSWTCAPGCLSPSQHGHVRMMTLTGLGSTEIILD